MAEIRRLSSYYERLDYRLLLSFQPRKPQFDFTFIE